MAKLRVATVLVVTTAVILGATLALPRAQQSPQEIEQLVAPVALYPDELLAEVLAAATYPADVDDAAQWLERNATLTSDKIAGAVDQMPWDSSVKALTEFPTVLAEMERNLSWTSALGDAYFNQPDDVMDAVQALRARAIAAGTLQSTSQITVSNQNGIIVIEPADSEIVYTPIYDYWNGFGAPINPWPGFVFAPGFVRGGPRIVWGIGFRIGGAWSRVNWGWHNWAFDWRNRQVVFHRQSYVSHSPSVIDRHVSPRVRPGEPSGRSIVEPPDRRGGAPSLPARATPRPVEHPSAPPPTRPMTAAPIPPKPPGDVRTNRGFPPPPPATPPTGTHTGAMSGIGHGGVVTSNASRGRSSMGAPPPARGASPPPPPHAAPPPARSAPPPPPPPPNGRGRGRL